MFFCNKCRYMYNVTKDIKNKQLGGQVNESLTNIFDKFRHNEVITKDDIKKIKNEDILNDERYDNMTKKEQKRMVSWLKGADKTFFAPPDKTNEPKIGSNQGYFICKYCKNTEPIAPATIIYSEIISGVNISETVNYDYAINDYTLARTRNYICKNTKCPTHNDINSREAVITKNDQEQVVYICRVCSTNWVNVY